MKSQKRIKISKRVFTDYILIVLGTFIAGCGVALFNTPAKIASGGVNGISTILYHTLGFEPGIAMLIINIPIFITGMKVFGPKYGIKSVLGMTLFSLSISVVGQLTNYQGVLDYSNSMNVFLSGLFGGTLIGGGIGLVMRSGANTGGTDIIAQIINRYTNLSIGTCLLLINGLIILTSAFFFGLELAMYAIIAAYTSSQATSYVLMGLGTKYAKTVFIFSDNLEELKRLVIEELGHGGTIFIGEGIYTGQKREMLMAVVPNQQISLLTWFVHHQDPKAFMIIQEAYQVLGKGFKPITTALPTEKPRHLKR